MTANQKYSSNKTKQNNALIVFVRYPEAGKVKTRLAEGTNKDFARDIYKLCAEKIFGEISFLKNFNKYIFYSEAKDKEKIIQWTNNKFLYSLQKGGDLGERMFNAFEFVFNQRNQKAIIIGTDIPDLSKEIILKAEAELDNNDLVIGPAFDGGYYLLGMKKAYYNLLEDVKWGSGSVFNSTMKKASSLNLVVREMQMLHDIDTKKELDEWLINPGNKILKRKIIRLK